MTGSVRDKDRIRAARRATAPGRDAAPAGIGQAPSSTNDRMVVVSAKPEGCRTANG